jgi:hypothetical protein
MHQVLNPSDYKLKCDKQRNKLVFFNQTINTYSPKMSIFIEDDPRHPQFQRPRGMSIPDLQEMPGARGGVSEMR